MTNPKVNDIPTNSNINKIDIISYIGVNITLGI